MKNWNCEKILLLLLFYYLDLIRVCQSEEDSAFWYLQAISPLYSIQCTVQITKTAFSGLLRRTLLIFLGSTWLLRLGNDISAWLFTNSESSTQSIILAQVDKGFWVSRQPAFWCSRFPMFQVSGLSSFQVSDSGFHFPVVFFLFWLSRSLVVFFFAGFQMSRFLGCRLSRFLLLSGFVTVQVSQLLTFQVSNLVGVQLSWFQVSNFLDCHFYALQTFQVSDLHLWLSRFGGCWLFRFSNFPRFIAFLVIQLSRFSNFACFWYRGKPISARLTKNEHCQVLWKTWPDMHDSWLETASRLSFIQNVFFNWWVTTHCLRLYFLMRACEQLCALSTQPPPTT